MGLSQREEVVCHLRQNQRVTNGKLEILCDSVLQRRETTDDAEERSQDTEAFRGSPGQEEKGLDPTTSRV